MFIVHIIHLCSLFHVLERMDESRCSTACISKLLELFKVAHCFLSNSDQVGCLLLICTFFFDIFWVFLSPLIFKKSVMIEARWYRILTMWVAGFA